MSDYTKGQDFSALRGQDADPAVFNTEFSLVATASASKADTDGPATFSSTVTGQAGGTGSNFVIATDIKLHSFTAGTTMAFANVNAPTGWTQNTSFSDLVLRIVPGAGGGSGGTGSISAGFTVDSHVLAAGEIPAHYHQLAYGIVTSRTGANGAIYSAIVNSINFAPVQPILGNTQPTGSMGGLGHAHTLNGADSWIPRYFDAIACSKD